MATRIKLVALAAVVLGVGVTGALAAIPGANGVITACVNSKGALKVIDAEAGQDCGAQQTLAWNQQGPAGPAGTSGRVIVTDTSPLNPNGIKAALAVCPPGKSVVGGGGKAFKPFEGNELNPIDVALTQSNPYVYGGTEGWSVYANETAALEANWAVRAYAICAYTT
jgi:hypothetical protein